MRYRCLVLFGALAAVTAVASVPLAGQAPQAAGSAAASTTSWTERTAWGDPDLQGLWRLWAGAELERAEEFAGRAFLTDAEVAAKRASAEERQAFRLSGQSTNRALRRQENYNSVFSQSDEQVRVSRRTSMIIDPPDGLLPPWTLEQVKRWEDREAATRGRGEGQSVEDVNAGARCIQNLRAAQVGAWGLGFGGRKSTAAAGEDTALDRVALGRGGGGGAGFVLGLTTKRILQAPGFVGVINAAFGHGDHHIIPLDGRPVPKIRQWMGTARGHWDGNTLVVEITNVYYPYPIIPVAGFGGYAGSGETLKVTERFTRTGPDSLDYRLTVEDPAVYTRPYTVVGDMFRDDNHKSEPSMCHENNRNMGNVLANARADEFQAIENGAYSARGRQPRLEELKKRAQEAANRESADSR